MFNLEMTYLRKNSEFDLTNNIAIQVNNQTEAAAFYSNILGMTEVFTNKSETNTKKGSPKDDYPSTLSYNALSNFSKNPFNTWAAVTQSFKLVHSFGLWLIPSWLRTKNMAIGICRPTIIASCPAPLGI